MSTNQLNLARVHLNLDPYQSRHSGFFFNTKGNREIVILGKKMLRENIFDWNINPFNPAEPATLEDGSSVNSQYNLTVHGPEFLRNYLGLMRNSAQQTAPLNCCGDIMLTEADIPWTFQERIDKFTYYLDFLGLNFPLANIRYINLGIVDIYVNNNTDISALENMLQQDSSFSQTDEPDGACWLYDPLEILAVKFRLIPVCEDEFDLHHGVMVNIDNQSQEYVDIRKCLNGRSNHTYQFWSQNSQNFCSYLRDYLTYRYQMSCFSDTMQDIYDYMDQDHRGHTFFLKALTERASQFRNIPQDDNLYAKLIPFICLNCSSHVYEITEASSIRIRKGFKAKISAVVYPRIPLKDRLLSFSCSRNGVVAVKMNNNSEGQGIAELSALAVGETEVYFYDGISDRSFGSISVEVDDPSYCKEIVWNQASVTLPTNSSISVGITCTPADALDIPRLRWSSSNRKVAYADENGNVYAGIPGTAILTVEGEDTSGQLQVIVKPRVDAVKTDNNKYEAYVNQYIPVQCWAEPRNCYDASINLSIDDPAIVTWDNQRKQLQARSQGETSITLYAAANPEISTKIWVKVSFVPEPEPPVIRSLYTLTILWCLLCWVSYVPLIIFAAQVYFAIKSVEEDRKNILAVCLIFTIQILIQLFIL